MSSDQERSNCKKVVNCLIVLGVQGHVLEEPQGRGCAAQRSTPVVEERLCLVIIEADKELVSGAIAAHEYPEKYARSSEVNLATGILLHADPTLGQCLRQGSAGPSGCQGCASVLRRRHNGIFDSTGQPLRGRNGIVPRFQSIARARDSRCVGV